MIYDYRKEFSYISRDIYYISRINFEHHVKIETDLGMAK